MNRCRSIVAALLTLCMMLGMTAGAMPVALAEDAQVIWRHWGYAQGEDGAPLSRVYVFVEIPGQSEKTWVRLDGAEMTTGEDGLWRFDLPEGRYRFRFSKSEYLTKSLIYPDDVELEKVIIIDEPDTKSIEFLDPVVLKIVPEEEPEDTGGTGTEGGTGTGDETQGGTGDGTEGGTGDGTEGGADSDEGGFNFTKPDLGTENTGTDTPGTGTDTPGQGDGQPTGDGNTPPTGDGNTPPTGDGNTPPTGDGNTPPTGDGNTPPTGDGNTPSTGDSQTPNTPSTGTEPENIYANKPVLKVSGNVLTTADTQIDWDPIEGVDTYIFTLTLEGADTPLVQVEQADTGYPLSAVQPPLEVGRRYQVTVTAVAGPNSESPGPGEPAQWWFDYVWPEQNTQSDAAGTPESGDAAQQQAAQGGPALAPIDGTGMQGQPIGISWSQVAGANRYDLYVAMGEEEPELVASVPGLSYEEYVPAQTGSYRAYVTAYQDGERVMQLPAVAFEVTTGSSVLQANARMISTFSFTDTTETTPATNKVELKILPTFDSSKSPYVRITWDDVAAATSYKVGIAAGSTEPTESKMYAVTKAAATAGCYIPASVLIKGGSTYTIKVIAVGANSYGTLTTAIKDDNAGKTTLGTPMFTGAVVPTGFAVSLVPGHSGVIQWTTVASATGYEWIVYDDVGNEYHPTTVTNATSIPWNDGIWNTLIAKQPGEAIRCAVAVRAVGANSTYGPWTRTDFVLVPTDVAYVSSFKASPNPVATGTSVTLTLSAVKYPASASVVYYNTNGNGQTVTGSAQTLSATHTITHTFADPGTYMVWISSGANVPYSAPEQITVTGTSAGGPTITPISAQEKNKAFRITWSAVPTATTYGLLVQHVDGSTPIVSNNAITTAYYDVPANATAKIGPYYAQVMAATPTGTLSSAVVAFNVTDGSYTSAAGTIKNAGTKAYQIANINAAVLSTLAKGDKVTIIGEQDTFYHVRIGATGTTAVYAFILKEGVTKGSSSGSGGSGGSSGGGSSGGGSSGGGSSSGTGSIATATYKETFGTSDARKTSYAYIAELYAPFKEGIEKGEIQVKDKIDLLATSFSPLPDELNSSQYDTVRERASWNLVLTYMSVIATDTVNENAGASDGKQKVAQALVSTIDQVTAKQTTLDDAVTKVLETLRTKANEAAAATDDGTLTGTGLAAAFDALTKIVNDPTLLDAELFPALQTALEPTLDTTEPYEIRFLRGLYALTDYRQTKLDAALNALSNTAGSADITKVQETYLEYVFAVAKLHQLAYAYGGAKAETVVANWGEEIARLMAVNKVYSAYSSN